MAQRSLADYFQPSTKKIADELLRTDNGSLYKNIETAVAAEVAKVTVPKRTRTHRGSYIHPSTNGSVYAFEDIEIGLVEDIHTAEIRLFPTTRHNSTDLVMIANTNLYAEFNNNHSIRIHKARFQGDSGVIYFEIWELK